MNLVETVAPISIENLKKYFVDKTTFYVIDYKNSSLRGTKLLTYLSNLDIPCDISFKDCDAADVYEMIKEYLHSSMIVNIQSLELVTISILMQAKNIVEVKDKEFIENNKDIINSWIEKIDSLTLYNMFMVNDSSFKDFVGTFPQDETTSLEGINFVSILKHQDMYNLYQHIDKSKLKYFTSYFNDYMFKGKSLYEFWANGNNPLFLLTYGIAEGMITGENYISATKQSIEELANATPV